MEMCENTKGQRGATSQGIFVAEFKTLERSNNIWILLNTYESLSSYSHMIPVDYVWDDMQRTMWKEI